MPSRCARLNLIQITQKCSHLVANMWHYDVNQTPGPGCDKEMEGGKCVLGGVGGMLSVQRIKAAVIYFASLSGYACHDNILPSTEQQLNQTEDR